MAAPVNLDTIVDRSTEITTPWLQGVNDHVNSLNTTSHDGSNISNTPAGNIAATTVQAAINELDNEKGGLATNNTWSGSNTFSGTTALNGTTTTVTQAANDNSTKVATTAYVDRISSSVVSPVVGGMRNAKMSVTAASASATFTADEIIVETALGGTAYRLSSYSQTINLATTGAGGMDTGSAPVSGFVALYAIAKTDGTKSILACSTATSNGTIYAGANMPSGYVASALIGTWPTNASSQFVVGFQRDRQFWWGAKQNVLATASAATTFTSVSVSAVVPPNAISLACIAGNGSTGQMLMALAGDSNGLGQKMGDIPSNGNTIDSFGASQSFENVPMVTAQTIYYKCTSSQTNARIDVTGYNF